MFIYMLYPYAPMFEINEYYYLLFSNKLKTKLCLWECAITIYISLFIKRQKYEVFLINLYKVRLINDMEMNGGHFLRPLPPLRTFPPLRPFPSLRPFPPLRPFSS